jgi:hypothetical protein
MMKGSFFKFSILLSLLILIVSFSGYALVKAQEAGGAGDEPGRLASQLPAKAPGQDARVGSTAHSGAGDEVKKPSGPVGEKGLFLNSATGKTLSTVPLAPGADIPQPEAVNASWKWFNVPGATFIPYSNVVAWTYGGAGCLNPSTAGFWRASVNIPDGSILKFMYFGFYNEGNSATSTTAFLYRFSYTGAYNTVAQVNSNPGSTTTNYGFVGVTIPDETVNNFANSYAFAWSGSSTTINQQLCYIQVGYVPPSIFGLALPIIQKAP